MISTFIDQVNVVFGQQTIYPFWAFLLVGFAAQMVDGCLGMAYGVLSTTFLTAIGLPPATASASIHFAEMFTTFTSAASHLKFRNVDKSLMKKLLIPGILGGVVGAYALSELDASSVKPFVNTYLLILGIYIVCKGLQKIRIRKVTDKIKPLGFIGGLFDAIGGGGWGPIVTTTLVARGNSPRKTIGTVNTAEFFVTLAQSATFFFCLGSYGQYMKIIAGLLIGGVIAAPLAALVCRKTNVKAMTILVGALIIATNVYALMRFFKVV